MIAVTDAMVDASMRMYRISDLDGRALMREMIQAALNELEPQVCGTPSGSPGWAPCDRPLGHPSMCTFPLRGLTHTIKPDRLLT